MINVYAGRKRPCGWSFLAHHWELIIVSLKENQEASGYHRRHLGDRPVQRTRGGHQQQDQADREDGL